MHDLLVRFQANDGRLAASNLFSTDGHSLSSSNLAVGDRIADSTSNALLQAGLVDALSGPGLQIGRPLGGLTGKILHEMVIPMRYAFRNKSGKPLFVVTAVIPMSKQREIWQPVSLPDGAALGLLRDDGVLVFGSGFITHNMRYAFRPGTPQWAKEFDAWAADALLRFDVDALLDFQTRAPAAQMALPTWEHFAPALVAVGAAADQRSRTSFPIAGWWMDGAFTKRSVQFG